MKFTIIAAVATAGLLTTAVTADASTFFATSVVDAVKGDTGVNAPPGRDDPTAALGAANGDFYSLGVDGFIVFEFGTPAGQPFGSPASTFEVTLSCSAGSTSGCQFFPESVDVYTGGGFTAGDGLSAITGGFTNQGEVTNVAASTAAGAVTILVGGPFTQLALVDTTRQYAGTNPESIPGGVAAPRDLADGFDVAAVKVAPIPVPAALPMMAAALGMIGWLGRRRVAA